jgi:hypothetical protein
MAYVITNALLIIVPLAPIYIYWRNSTTLAIFKESLMADQLIPMVRKKSCQVIVWPFHSHDLKAVIVERNVLHDKILVALHIQRQVVHLRGCLESFEHFVDSYSVFRLSTIGVVFVEFFPYDTTHIPLPWDS